MSLIARLRQTILRALLDYRCTQQMVDDGDDLSGDGLPLVDALTVRREPTIATGQREIEDLADALTEAVLDAELLR